MFTKKLLLLRSCHTRGGHHAWQHSVCGWPDDIDRCDGSIVMTPCNRFVFFRHLPSSYLPTPTQVFKCACCSRRDRSDEHVTIPNCHVHCCSNSCQEGIMRCADIWKCAFRIAGRQGCLMTMHLVSFGTSEGRPATIAGMAM